MPEFFKPNSVRIASKVFDGEAIIIDLSNGTYYSLRDVGGFVWTQIERGVSFSTLLESITLHYAVTREQAQADLRSLIADLQRSNLMEITDSTSPEPVLSPLSEKLSYQSPVLDVFEDMKALLALDPPMPSLDDLAIDSERK